MAGKAGKKDAGKARRKSKAPERPIADMNVKDGQATDVRGGWRGPGPKLPQFPGRRP
jgi:hypothetical protein